MFLTEITVFTPVQSEHIQNSTDFYFMFFCIKTGGEGSFLPSYVLQIKHYRHKYVDVWWNKCLQFTTTQLEAHFPVCVSLCMSSVGEWRTQVWGYWLWWSQFSYSPTVLYFKLLDSLRSWITEVSPRRCLVVREVDICFRQSLHRKLLMLIYLLFFNYYSCKKA